MNNKLLLERKAELWILAEKKLQIIPSSEKSKLKNNQLNNCMYFSTNIIIYFFNLYLLVSIYPSYLYILPPQKNSESIYTN